MGDYEGSQPTLRGFYLQDRSGDGTPATSDGIFVFNGNNDNVSLGQVVRVTGTAGEFQGQTQLSSVTSIVDLRRDGRHNPGRCNLAFPLRRFCRAVRRDAGPLASNVVRHRTFPTRALWSSCYVG